MNLSTTQGHGQNLIGDTKATTDDGGGCLMIKRSTRCININSDTEIYLLRDFCKGLVLFRATSVQIIGYMGQTDIEARFL